MAKVQLRALTQNSIFRHQKTQQRGHHKNHLPILLVTCNFDLSFIDMLPEAFVRAIQNRFGEEAEAFLAALDTPAPVTVRMHPIKGQNHAFGLKKPIPWHPNGRYLPARPIFATDPAWHAGAYYVQEASSMIVAEAVSQSLGNRIQDEIVALDLCAAPGGKSTVLLDVLSAQSVVVANEVIKTRVPVLTENLERWGYSNMAITSAEVEQFAPLAGMFDLILIDAPCSGEGMFRKDPHAAAEWSREHVDLCASRQRRIMLGAAPLLAPGGVLIYSTCTFNAKENDENVAWLADLYELEIIPLELQPVYGFVSTKTGYAAYPHRVQGEGFFIAALRNKVNLSERITPKTLTMKRLERVGKKLVGIAEPWLLQPNLSEMWMTKHGSVRYMPKEKPIFTQLEKHIPHCFLGRSLGEIKGTDLIPDHALALANDVAIPRTLELTETEALAYLRKQDLNLEVPLGWYSVTYQGLSLGWVKVLSTRINNYLPVERRLRML
jgi:16S rRNA C967 or C1407 C5-methylase (RsmB/RsmF family)/NOL1/NOP2/fmu family ribosome biogenesis protein